MRLTEPQLGIERIEFDLLSGDDDRLLLYDQHDDETIELGAGVQDFALLRPSN